MSDYLLQESGFRIGLEDGSGFLLLEESTSSVTLLPRGSTAVVTPPELPSATVQRARDAS